MPTMSLPEPKSDLASKACTWDPAFPSPLPKDAAEFMTQPTCDHLKVYTEYCHAVDAKIPQNQLFEMSCKQIIYHTNMPASRQTRYSLIMTTSHGSVSFCKNVIWLILSCHALSCQPRCNRCRKSLIWGRLLRSFLRLIDYVAYILSGESDYALVFA